MLCKEGIGHLISNGTKFCAFEFDKMRNQHMVPLLHSQGQSLLFSGPFTFFGWIIEKLNKIRMKNLNISSLPFSWHVAL